MTARGTWRISATSRRSASSGSCASRCQVVGWRRVEVPATLTMLRFRRSTVGCKLRGFCLTLGAQGRLGSPMLGAEGASKLRSSTLTSWTTVKRVTGIVCRTVGTVIPSRSILGTSPVCSTSWYLRQLIYQLVERDRIVPHADAGRVVDCVRDRRRHAAEAKLANALGLHG